MEIPLERHPLRRQLREIVAIAQRGEADYATSCLLALLEHKAYTRPHRPAYTQFDRRLTRTRNRERST